MKPLLLTLSFAAALAAMPAMAQDNGSPQKPLVFEIDQDADFGLALLSLDDGTIPFMGNLVLSNALVLVLGKQDDGSFQTFANLPMQCDADLWWQGVTWDAVDGLTILPVEKLAADDSGKVDESWDEAGKGGEVHDEAAERPVAGQVMGAPSEPAPEKEGAVPAPLPIELSFLPADDGTPSSLLQAKLIGPTSDYGLVLVKVSVDAGGNADVFVYRKVPGVGEGMLDVVEEHTVTADVAGATAVRVFLATGTKSQPGTAIAWRLLTTLAP